MIKRLARSLCCIALLWGLTACSGSGNGTTQAPETTATGGIVDINPQTPVDKAQDAADDANAAIDEQQSDVQELTDDQ